MTSENQPADPPVQPSPPTQPSPAAQPSPVAQPSPPAQASPPTQPSPVAAITSKGAVGFLMIAAIIVVGGHVLFGVIMGEFPYGTTYVVVALLILMSTLGTGSGIGSTLLQRVLGYFLGLSGVVLLLSDIRFGFPDGIVDNLANLVFYVAAVLAFLGARGLKD